MAMIPQNNTIGGIEPEVIELILQRKYFYGHLLQQFARHIFPTKSSMGQVIKTLAVNVTASLQPNLFINSDFYNSGDGVTWGMTQDEKMALLEHEILHILNKHFLRTEERNHYVFNLANDLAINQYIKNLPRGGVCPECNIFVRKTAGGLFPKNCPVCKVALDPDKDICEPLRIDEFKVEGKKIDLPAEKPSETYYDILIQKMPRYIIEIGSKVTGGLEKGAKEGIGEGEAQPDGTYKQKGDSDGSGEGQKKVGSGNAVDVGQGTKIPMPLDDHQAWAAGSDDKEMAHEKVKDMVRKAVHKAGEKSQGYMPGWMKGLIDECLTHKTVKWKSELRKFYGYEEFSHFLPTRKRLNRRFDLQPGYKVERKAHFVVAVDSSGSIDDKEFAAFFREIDFMLMAKITLTMVEIDADITHIEEYKRRPKHRNGIKRYGYGGTDFRPVFKFVEKGVWKNGNKEMYKLKKKVSGIIYLTDGYGTFPETVPCPTIWVLTPNSRDVEWNPKLGKKIVMDAI
jgi:predicted metal-dependent peptidase